MRRASNWLDTYMWLHIISIALRLIVIAGVVGVVSFVIWRSA